MQTKRDESSSPTLAVITGLGAVTTVGRSARSACAAIRAGVARPSPFSEFRVLDHATQETVPLMAHAMQGYTDGFSLVGRWIRLARGAASDLLASAGLPNSSDRAFWSTTGLTAVCAVPDDDVFLSEEPGESLSMIRDGFFAPLQFVLGLPIEAGHMDLVPLGHAGTALAIARAAEKLARSELERVLVLAADSNFDPLALENFAANRRLKLPDNPAGFMPGEAGACFLLERETSARRRHASKIAKVTSAMTAKEPSASLRARSATGEGLAMCVSAVLDRISPDSAFEGDVVLDLTGENWRASEWGEAQVRLAGRTGMVREHVPGVSVGEIGAASGALGVCYAAHLLDRNVARTDTVLVLSSSVPGDLGCVALKRSPRV